MEKIINAFKQIEALSDQEPDIVRPLASAYCTEHNVGPVSTIEAAYHELNSNANKLLNIGIVGRVKAGKSSLLNAIFFKGEDILPKAATPMTASLTLLSFGDNKASVELFNKGDVADIKKEHDAYLAIKDSKLQAYLSEAKKEDFILKPQHKDKIQQRVEKEMLSHASRAYYDLYEGICSNKLFAQIEQSDKSIIQTLNADSPQAIAAELNNYVGSSGVNSKITKSAQLELAFPELKDLRIIDTPGLNDPVASRSQRTMDFIKQCDVIFVISPSSQFMSKADVNLMVNAIQEQSINKIYVVASQADMTMISDVADKNNFVFDQSFESLRNSLQDGLAACMQGNERQVLRDAISGAQVLLTSSICFSLERKLSAGQPLSENEQLALTNLTNTYPSAFSDQEQTLSALRKLAGVSAVHEAIAQVRADKDVIIKERQEIFARDQQASVERYIEYLQKKLDEEKTKLEDTDLAQIKTAQDGVAKTRNKIALDINVAFNRSFKYLKAELRKQVSNLGNDFTDNSKANAQQQLNTTIRTYTYTTGWWFWKKYHTGTEETKTIDTSAVRREVQKLLRDMVNGITSAQEQFLYDWIEKAVREEVDVTAQLDTNWCMEHGLCLQDIEHAVKLSIFELKDRLPKLDVDELLSQNNDSRFTFLFSRSVSSSEGKLRDSEADNFLKKLGELMDWFDCEFNNKCQQYLDKLQKLSDSVDISQSIFGKLDDQLEGLEKQLSDRENTLVRYQKCQEKLAQIVAKLKEA